MCGIPSESEQLGLQTEGVAAAAQGVSSSSGRTVTPAARPPVHAYQSPGQTAAKTGESDYGTGKTGGVRRERSDNGAQPAANPRGRVGQDVCVCVRARGRGGTDGRSGAGERKGRGRAPRLSGSCPPPGPLLRGGWGSVRPEGVWQILKGPPRPPLSAGQPRGAPSGARLRWALTRKLKLGCVRRAAERDRCEPVWH